MCAFGQPRPDGGFAGSGALTHLLQPHRVLARVASTDNTEGEIWYPHRLLIEATKKSVSVVDQKVPLCSVRARRPVLPAPRFFLRASASQAGPFAEVPNETVFTSGYPWALATSTSFG